MRKIVVHGAGGHAKTVVATVEAAGVYEILGLLDDDQSKQGLDFYGYEVLGGREELSELRDQGVRRVIVAVGRNRDRAEITQLMTEKGFELAQAIHPTATLLRGCRVGEGTVVLPNAFVGADALVGGGAIISIGVIVGHDARVGAFAQLCPRVSLGGGVTVGAHSFVGTRASILPNVTLGCQTVVGANAVVTRDLPDGVTAVGVPARMVKGGV